MTRSYARWRFALSPSSTRRRKASDGDQSLTQVNAVILPEDECQRCRNGPAQSPEA
jgi:hypothetical protein